jgi:hypothetical protein
LAPAGEPSGMTLGSGFFYSSLKFHSKK